jgi:hypothetical protein
MTEIIEFKPRKRTAAANVFEELANGWNLLQISSKHAIRAFAFGSNTRWSFESLFNQKDHVVLALQTPSIIESMTEIILPKMFCVFGKLEINNSTIKEPPRYIKCWDLTFNGSRAVQLADRLCVLGDLTISNSSLDRISQALVVDNDLKILRTKHVLPLPQLCTVRRNLDVETALIRLGGYQTIVAGEVFEKYPDTKFRCLGTDFIGRLLGPGSRMQFMNLVEWDRFGFPINVQDTKESYGEFVGRNEDGTYTCSMETADGIKLVDVHRMDVIGVPDVAEPEIAALGPAENDAAEKVVRVKKDDDTEEEFNFDFVFDDIEFPAEIFVIEADKIPPGSHTAPVTACEHLEGADDQQER